MAENIYLKTLCSVNLKWKVFPKSNEITIMVVLRTQTICTESINIFEILLQLPKDQININKKKTNIKVSPYMLQLNYMLLGKERE